MSYKEILSVPGIRAVYFTVFMVSFGFGVILPLLPFYALAHGAQPIELGMLTATFALMSIIFSPFLGRIADRIGRKKVILFGTALFVVSYLVFSQASSLPVLFAARAIEGLAAACTFPSCLSLISDYTSENQRGKAMSLFSMSFSLGYILGPAVGGLAAGISVPAAFLLSSGLACANFAAVYFQLREPHEREESKGITDVRREISFAEHIASPLLFLFLSTFVVAFMIGGLDATLAIYTGDKLGFTAVQIGILFTFIGAMILAMQLVFGNIVNKYGELSLIPAGFLLSGFGFLLLTITHDWLTILVPLAIFVAGNTLVFPSVNSLISKKVAGKRGGALGLVSSFQSLGQVAGPLLGGFLYGYGHDWPFIAMALVIWAYFFLFLLFGRGKILGWQPVKGPTAAT